MSNYDPALVASIVAQTLSALDNGGGGVQVQTPTPTPGSTEPTAPVTTPLPSAPSFAEVPSASVPVFVTDEAVDAAIAAANESIVTVGGIRTSSDLVLRPNSMVEFATQATHPLHDDISLSRGALYVESLGLVEATLSWQNYVTPTPDGTTRFRKLEMLIRVAGTLGFFDPTKDGEPLTKYSFLNGRSNVPSDAAMLLYVQTLGVDKTGATDTRLHTMLTAPALAGGLGSEWGAVSTAASQVQGGPAELSQSQSNTIWRIGPKTGQMAGAAHLREALSRPVPLDELTLSIPVPGVEQRRQHPFTDFLTEVQNTLAQDIIDTAYCVENNIPIADVRRTEAHPRARNIGSFATNLGGISPGVDRESGTYGFEFGRFPKRTDVTSMVISGQRLALLGGR